MTTITPSTQASRSRLILQPRSRLLTGLRVLPAALVLLGAVSFSPAAGATSCHGGLVAVNGGHVTNSTTLDLSADGGLALSSADGGDNNLALAGDNSVALAGNGGLAAANANGGMIDLDDINSGNNRGNTIAVSGGGGCGGQTLVAGGTVRNETTLTLSADGGTALASADGGNGNIAVAGANGAAAAGNGGVANAEANGGAITIGDINSGNNRGNTIAVSGSGSGAVLVDGGNVTNDTTIAISADGGTALASADGGDNNIAAAGNNGTAAAGNGGVANAEANGGSISLGDVNSGNNQGNQIAVSGNGSGTTIVDGGNVSNSTSIDLSADGGTAVSSADGGDGNLAIADTNGDAAAGNGGVANAEANGGSISLGDVNSGGNEGNTIVIGN